jgi:NAD(P)H-nitrite reductase large subunit
VFGQITLIFTPSLAPKVKRSYFCALKTIVMIDPEENIICNCMDVSEHEIVYCVKHQDAVMVQDIIEVTGAGTGCGSCHGDLEEILVRERDA